MDELTIECKERLAKTVLSLPLHPYMEAKDVSFVVESIKSFFNVRCLCQF